MKKLIVEKIDNKTIRIEDLSRQTKQVYAAEFRAQGNERGKTVKIYNANENVVYLANYAEIEVNGRSSWANVQEVVSELNTFLGNFKNGGSASVENADPSYYVRPADRPTPPTFSAGEQAVYWLFGVYESGLNDYAFRITESSGSYMVDWGDGTVETVDNNTTAEHLYNYDSINIPVGSEGYKWVWIKATPIGGNITTLKIGEYLPTWALPPSQSVDWHANIFEIYMQGEHIEQIPFPSVSQNSVSFLSLEAFYSFGENKITSFDMFLRRSYNLKKISIYSNNGISFQNFLRDCRSFNDDLHIDTGKAINMNWFLINCFSFNKPLRLNTSECKDLGGFMSGCNAFNSEIEIDTSNCVSFGRFMERCISFNKKLNINTHTATSFGWTLDEFYAFGKKITFDVTSSNNTLDGILQGGRMALTGVRFLNMSLIHSKINFPYKSFNVKAVMELYEDLPDRSSTTAGTLNISGNPAILSITDAEIDMFIAKNWTLILA